MIYLDNCATTKPDPEVVKVMVKALEEHFANPSSLHCFGHKIEREIEEMRVSVGRLIGADEEEIYFTSGGTESNNIAVHGLIEKNKRRGNKIITTAIEHSSIMDQFRHYGEKGYEVVFLKVNSKGHIDVEELLEEINGETILLSLFHVHNELGTINPLEEIVKRVRAKNPNVLIHADGVQACGKIKVDVKTLGLDTYSISSHKIYGPKGVGALYLRNGLTIPSLVIGGGQEKGLRSGTENVPGILGFGKACQLSFAHFQQNYNHALEIKKHLLEHLESHLDHYQLNMSTDASPYIISLSIEGIRGEVLLHYLEGDDIYISTASACSSHGTKKVSTLSQIGLEDSLAEGTIRICTCKDTSKEEIEVFIQALIRYVSEIRQITGR